MGCRAKRAYSITFDGRMAASGAKRSFAKLLTSAFQVRAWCANKTYDASCPLAARWYVPPQRCSRPHQRSLLETAGLAISLAPQQKLLDLARCAIAPIWSGLSPAEVRLVRMKPCCGYAICRSVARLRGEQGSPFVLIRRGRASRTVRVTRWDGRAGSRTR